MLRGQPYARLSPASFELVPEEPVERDRRQPAIPCQLEHSLALEQNTPRRSSLARVSESRDAVDVDRPELRCSRRAKRGQPRLGSEPRAYQSSNFVPAKRMEGQRPVAVAFGLTQRPIQFSDEALLHGADDDGVREVVE